MDASWAPSSSICDAPPRQKRKYDHEPLMRAEKQFRKARQPSYQTASPQSVNKSDAVLRNLKPSWERMSVSTNDAAQSHHPAPASVADSHIFVIHTVGSMKNGHSVDKTLRSRVSPQTVTQSADQRSCQGTPQPDRKYVLRPSRPIKISDQVNSDIWQTILGYCEPKLLLEARTINSTFYRLLNDRSGIWRQCRRTHFGSDMPDCPVGLTEQQYVDLLVGRGCQSRACPKERTARVYWTFQVRLCAECFKQKTMREDDLPFHRRHSVPASRTRGSGDTGSLDEGSLLWELLPLARSDSRRYVHPRPVDISTNSYTHSLNLRQFVFLKSAYSVLEDMYLSLVRAHPGLDAIRKSLDNIHKKAMAFMIEVAEIENWHKKHTSLKGDLQQERATFFKACAAELSPPMDAQILSNMAAFQRVLRVQQPPTVRSWNTLKQKILPYRLQAEQVEEFKMAMSLNDSPRSALLKERFRKLHDHRSGRKRQPRVLRTEQAFVLQLAQKEFARCLASDVADSDLLLLCLQNVFDEYARLNTRPVGLNFDGTRGPYCLTLDDARMIVEEVMESRISRLSPRGLAVFQSLKCRGCRRTDFVRTWSFTEAFEHILETHAKLVGEGLEFWQFAVPYSPDYEAWNPGKVETNHIYGFPWYTVPWPRCLPLVPEHQDPSKLGDWHPAVGLPFVQLEKRAAVSAFEGRLPLLTSLSPIDFVGNLVFAARTLSGSWLGGPCQMKIAMKYALGLYTGTMVCEPPLSIASKCFKQLQEANSTIDLRFTCGVCAGEGKVHHRNPKPGFWRSVRQVQHRFSVENLLAHWDDKHQDSGVPWSQGLMLLPSDSEVLEMIVEADQRLRGEQEATQERVSEASKHAKKRPRLKGNVVMQARLARTAFDELFPPQSASWLSTKLETRDGGEDKNSSRPQPPDRWRGIMDDE